MLVEIPDPDVIAGIILAFVGGLAVFFIYNQVKSYFSSNSKGLELYLKRLEHYEKQLIDMKIRLDALEIENLNIKTTEKEEKPPMKNTEQDVLEPVQEEKQERLPNLGYNDIIEHILQLITNKPMTSRDIQITIGRTREHTARLMKKLFEDGFVQRKTDSKPYTYVITEKGKERLKLIKTVEGA